MTVKKKEALVDDEDYDDAGAMTMMTKTKIGRFK